MALKPRGRVKYNKVRTWNVENILSTPRQHHKAMWSAKSHAGICRHPLPSPPPPVLVRSTYLENVGGNIFYSLATKSEDWTTVFHSITAGQQHRWQYWMDIADGLFAAEVLLVAFSFEVLALNFFWRQRKPWSSFSLCQQTVISFGK